MSLALVRKEVLEHGIVVVMTILLGALALFTLLIAADQEGGRFIALIRYSMVIGTLTAVLLSNRLFVREYAGRSQLFLETLPLGRTRVFATKWLLGCGLMLLIVASAWFANLWWIRKTEVLPWLNALNTLLSIALFTFALWSFAAMAGMLGRYRYVAWIAAVLLVSAVDTVAGIAVGDIPVFRLLGSDVQMALGTPDMRAILYALAAAAVFTAAAAALALAGSGAMASTLAQRMTARELVFVLAASLVFVTIVTTLEPKTNPPPFAISGGERVDGEHALASVMPTADFESAAASSLASTIVRDLDTLIDALGVEANPTVFILPQQGLDRTVMQRAPLSDSAGIVLKIAPDAPLDSVRALVVHSFLSDFSVGRGLKEDRHVLLDGLASMWALRDDEAAKGTWWLRAASIGEPLRSEHLTRWSTTSERLGDCLSQAVAFSVAESLTARLGRERMLALMRKLFSPQPDDVRVLFESAPETLLEQEGFSWSDVAAAAEAMRVSVRTNRGEVLAQRPTLLPQIEWTDSAERGVTIQTSLQGAERYSVFYTLLRPWTADVGEMPRLDVRGERAVLPLSPPRGARVLAVIEVEDETLGCPIRVHTERLTLP